MKVQWYFLNCSFTNFANFEITGSICIFRNVLHISIICTYCTYIWSGQLLTRRWGRGGEVCRHKDQPWSWKLSRNKPKISLACAVEQFNSWAPAHWPKSLPTALFFPKIDETALQCLIKSSEFNPDSTQSIAGPESWPLSWRVEIHHIEDNFNFDKQIDFSSYRTICNVPMRMNCRHQIASDCVVEELVYTEIIWRKALGNILRLEGCQIIRNAVWLQRPLEACSRINAVSPSRVKP